MTYDRQLWPTIFFAFEHDPDGVKMNRYLHVGQRSSLLKLLSGQTDTQNAPITRHVLKPV